MKVKHDACTRKRLDRKQPWECDGWDGRVSFADIEPRVDAEGYEYEDESPCTITDKEEDDGGAAPATAERNQELDESKDEKDGFE
jgi:hypothetical protein